MGSYLAKRVRFQNGERISVLRAPNGLPVHEVTLFLGTYRTKGKAANTIHLVCRSLALLYRFLLSQKIDLLARLGQGKFLTISELDRLASSVQYRMDDLDEDESSEKSNVINILRISMRRKSVDSTPVTVAVGTQAHRLRYIAKYLEYVSRYVGATLDDNLLRQQLKVDTADTLAVFREHIPVVSKRAKLGARVGLSLDEQNRILSIVDPSSPDNPWSRSFVRFRNWLIVVLLLATGMRQGELLGLQIGDLGSNSPKLKILRRADAKSDKRTTQPATKTSDREIELTPAIMKVLWHYINHERANIAAARKIPQVIVSDEGEPLSASSIDKLFADVRAACPGLTVTLTSHVMRHTWNERFSEQADAMGLSDSVEQKARNVQQGWADNSEQGAAYTRRHTAKKGREVSLKLQEKLDDKLISKQ